MSFLPNFQKKAQMKVANKAYVVVGKHDDESSVILDNKRCMIRYTARVADHIGQQRFDPQHKISIREVNSLFKKAIIPNLRAGAGRSVALGLHNDKVYELYFRRKGTLIDVVSCFISSEIELISIYKDYEQSRNLTRKALR